MGWLQQPGVPRPSAHTSRNSCSITHFKGWFESDSGTCSMSHRGRSGGPTQTGSAPTQTEGCANDPDGNSQGHRFPWMEQLFRRGNHQRKGRARQDDETMSTGRGTSSNRPGAPQLNSRRLLTVTRICTMRQKNVFEFLVQFTAYRQGLSHLSLVSLLGERLPFSTSEGREEQT